MLATKTKLGHRLHFYLSSIEGIFTTLFATKLISAIVTKKHQIPAKVICYYCYYYCCCWS